MAGIPGAGIASPLAFTAAYGIGRAISPLLVPGIQDLENAAWHEHTVRPLAAEQAAAAVVEGIWGFDRAKTEASYTGISESRLKVMQDLIDDPPDMATLYELWRRHLISEDQFKTAAGRHRIEPEWIDGLVALHDRLLSPDQTANARQRGFMSRAEQLAENRLQGITDARSDIQFDLSGLPPPPERAREMWRRGIITQGEFEQAIVEGNEKIKYVDEEVALFHPLLTPAQIVNQRLRGWRNTAWMNDRLAEHGYTTEQANDLFEGQGRPISFRQVFIGERRNGTYNGPTAPIDDAFLKSLQESNIRPEWYNLAWAQRHTLPSAFVLRRLAQDGDITPVQTRTLLEWSGWPDFLIDAVVDSWTGGTAQGADATVKAAQNQAVTEIRSAYLLGQADAAQARGWLSRIGISAATVSGLLPIWDVMREVPQKGLTATQIVNAAYRLPQLWPRSRALAELQELGYTAGDANTLLDS